MPTMMVLDPGLHQHFYHFGVEHCDVHFRGEGVLDNTGFLGWFVAGARFVAGDIWKKWMDDDDDDDDI